MSRQSGVFFLVLRPYRPPPLTRGRGTLGGVLCALDSLADVLLNRFQEYLGVFDLRGDFGFRHKVEVIVIAFKANLESVINNFGKFFGENSCSYIILAKRGNYTGMFFGIESVKRQNRPHCAENTVVRAVRGCLE